MIEPAPRTVKPRKRTYTHRPLVVVTPEGAWFERGDNFVPLAALPATLKQEPSSIVVSRSSVDVLMMMNDAFATDPRWQFKVKPLEREIWRPNSSRVVARSLVIPIFFGWKHPNRKSKYHYPLEPLTFANASLDSLVPEDASELDKLVSFATDVRRFCIENRLEIRPTNGGIAGQLLRDPRFWPDARRKVPKATNRTARAQLPGNHYELRAEPEVKHAATYLDQSAAHHNAARDLSFPAADRLYARGYFRTLKDKPLPDGARFLAGNWHGLLYVRLRSPIQPRGAWVPPFMREPGSALAYVFTNELDLVRECGGYVEYVVAAWVADAADRGLNRYAEWALAEIDDADAHRKRWMKPTLLATYGVLAARPKRIEFGFRVAERGEPVVYRTPHGGLEAMQVQTKRELETTTANVIHRGMIEAETRARSLRLARDLHAGGHEVLGVYADAVFVRAGMPVPLLPHPWRVSGHLTDLRFFNATSFVSNEMERLPGIPREARLDLQRERAMKQDARRPFRRRKRV